VGEMRDLNMYIEELESRVYGGDISTTKQVKVSIALKPGKYYHFESFSGMELSLEEFKKILEIGSEILKKYEGQK
jgi:hypothetical protein